jgi:hypothetical protein
MLYQWKYLLSKSKSEFERVKAQHLQKRNAAVLQAQSLNNQVQALEQALRNEMQLKENVTELERLNASVNELEALLRSSEFSDRYHSLCNMVSNTVNQIGLKDIHVSSPGLIS